MAHAVHLIVMCYCGKGGTGDEVGDLAESIASTNLDEDDDNAAELSEDGDDAAELEKKQEELLAGRVASGEHCARLMCEAAMSPVRYTADAIASCCTYIAYLDEGEGGNEGLGDDEVMIAAWVEQNISVSNQEGCGDRVDRLRLQASRTGSI